MREWWQTTNGKHWKNWFGLRNQLRSVRGFDLEATLKMNKVEAAFVVVGFIYQSNVFHFHPSLSLCLSYLPPSLPSTHTQIGRMWRRRRCGVTNLNRKIETCYGASPFVLPVQKRCFLFSWNILGITRVDSSNSNSMCQSPQQNSWSEFVPLSLFWFFTASVGCIRKIPRHLAKLKTFVIRWSAVGLDDRWLKYAPQIQCCIKSYVSKRTHVY